MSCTVMVCGPKSCFSVVGGRERANDGVGPTASGRLADTS